jgi:hypothetical protein
MIAVLLLLLQTTILNTSIVAVDRPGLTITVRADAGADGTVDRTSTRRLAVAPSAAGRLAMLKAGNAVLLTLRGDTVVDIRIATRAAQPRIPQLPPGATSPTNRGVPQLPAGTDFPQGRPIPQVVPSGRVPAASPSPEISPASVAPRPAVSPVSVASPRSPGTPRPVVLPSDPPPTPMPSPTS